MIDFDLKEGDKKAIERAREIYFQKLAKKIVEEFNKNPEYWIEKINEKNTDI